ncbi:MAG TPA: hypothetical protein VK464_28000 [Symbiobacteriaceae bacterium]|nr:hypothetical protein [Symbiobacteriaceae bacterium]
MKRSLIALGLAALAGLAVGCSRPTTACHGAPGTITVCVNGRRVLFPPEFQPHRHEAGSLYAPAELLAQQLGLDVRTHVSADGQSALITVNRKPFAPAMAHGAMGVHVHDGVVYVPLRELAIAAGLKLEMDEGVGVAGFAK